MPYIAIKAYPKDPVVKRRVAERIRQVFLEEWGCSQQAISLSFEEVPPEDWVEKVQRPEIDARSDRMTILNGELR